MQWFAENQIRLVCKNVRVCNSAIQVLQQIPVLCPLDYSRDSDLTQGSYLQHPEMMMFEVLGGGEIGGHQTLLIK